MFISYYMPPAGGGGVQRASKFVKYLPDFNWQPLVLTVKEEAHQLRDESLQADIQPGTPVITAPLWRLPPRLPWRVRQFFTRWFLLIDEQIGWLPGAVRLGMKATHRGQIEAIFSTSPPYTAHLIARKIHLQTNIPWIADFRDPWIGNFSSHFPSGWHRSYAANWEAQIVQAAARVTSVSQPINRAFLTRYPQLPAERFVVIPNGYDPQDFEKWDDQPSRMYSSAGDGYLKIVYTGSLYGSRQTARHFLHGLRLAIDQLTEAKIRVQMVGNFNPDVVGQISAMRLTGYVQLTGYQPHKKSIELLRSADLLLLIIGSGTGMEGVVTGKIFEYLAARKPILALVPPGSAAELVCSARAGVVVPPDDVNAICSALVELYARWESHELKIDSDQAVILPYDRRSLTGRLAAEFDQVSGIR